jgi:predicted Fe-S protein YdhL (DUF1289 family)
MTAMDGTTIAFPAAVFMVANPSQRPQFMTDTGSPAIESPCIKICALDPASDLCNGCGRTLDEIARWYGLSNDERLRIMAELPARMESLRQAYLSRTGKT